MFFIPKSFYQVVDLTLYKNVFSRLNDICIDVAKTPDNIFRSKRLLGFVYIQCYELTAKTSIHQYYVILFVHPFACCMVMAVQSS